MEIHYDNDTVDGAFYPSEIDYTGNEGAGIKPYNKVKFIYQTRPDVITKWRAGSKSVINKRLAEIQIYTEGKLSYAYKIRYDQNPNTNRSKIISIQETDANGNSYPATTFSWQNNQEGWIRQPSLDSPVRITHAAIDAEKTTDMGSRFIDLNADGVTDVVENGVISPTDVRRSLHKHRNNLAKCTEVHITSRNNSYRTTDGLGSWSKIPRPKRRRANRLRTKQQTNANGHKNRSMDKHRDRLGKK